MSTKMRKFLPINLLVWACLALAVVAIVRAGCGPAAEFAAPIRDGPGWEEWSPAAAHGPGHDPEACVTCRGERERREGRAP